MMDYVQISSGFSMSYIFTFDLSSEKINFFINDDVNNRLSSFVEGIYSISKNELIKIGQCSPSYIDIYKNDMYELRFKKSILTERKSIIIQFPTYEIEGLKHKFSDLINKNSTIKINCISTLNELGVGSLTLWLELENHPKYGFEELQKFRDVDNLETTIDWRMGKENNSLRFKGIFSLSDLARFYIITIFLSLYKKVKLEYVRELIEQDCTPSEIHLKIALKCSRDIDVSNEIQHYPIFHISFLEYENPDINFCKDFIEKYKSQLRGLITGDINWDKKKDEIVNDFIEKHNFSSRDSIYWFSHSNGSMKIYSSNLETPLVTSKVLISFEMEIILTMKHFIYRVIRNLNLFSSLPKKTFPMRAIAKLRNEEMQRLDEYYNLDFLQKDTTVSRLDIYMKIFKINDILQIALKKFDSLDVYLTTEYQNSSANRDLALTIIFGAIGAGTIAFEMLGKGIEQEIITLSYFGHIAFSIGSMVIVGILIYIIYGQIKMK